MLRSINSTIGTERYRPLNMPLVDMWRPIRQHVGADVAALRADHLRVECADHNVVAK